MLEIKPAQDFLGVFWVDFFGRISMGGFFCKEFNKKLSEY